MRTAVVVLGSVVGGMAALGLGFLLAFRTGFGPVLTLVRRANRRFTNPRQLRTAGQPGAYASVVHHVGRRSGTAYRTPVVAQPVDDGFLIALPYGRRTDWVANVVADGGATLEHEGERVAVDEPTFVPMEDANPHFDPGEQRSHRMVGLAEALHLRRAA